MSVKIAVRGTRNLLLWTNDLRTTDIAQGTGQLEEIRDAGEVARCCLGVGCDTAGLPRVVHDSTVCYDGAADLAPATFHTWLGLPHPANVGADVYIDWPEDLRDRVGSRFRYVTCSNLNDEFHLSFPQIADVVDYFGVVAP